MAKQRCEECGRVIERVGDEWSGSIKIHVEGDPECFHKWKEE